MAKQKIETSIEINGIDVVAYPLVESDHVTFENGMSINEMIKGDVATPVVTHEEISFKVGKGDSDVSSSIVDGSVGEMTIKGQTYQNILPEPSLRNSMSNGKTTQKINEGYDNVNVVDGVGKNAILKGQTLVNYFNPNTIDTFPNEGFPLNESDYSRQRVFRYKPLLPYEEFTEYTAFVWLKDATNPNNVPLNLAMGNKDGRIYKFKNGLNIAKITTGTVTDNVNIRIGNTDVINGAGATLVGAVILKGDYTTLSLNSPFYGMKSVESPVLKTTSLNILPQSDFKKMNSLGEWKILRHLDEDVQPLNHYKFDFSQDSGLTITKLEGAYPFPVLASPLVEVETGEKLYLSSKNPNIDHAIYIKCYDDNMNKIVPLEGLNYGDGIYISYNSLCKHFVNNNLFELMIADSRIKYIQWSSILTGRSTYTFNEIMISKSPITIATTYEPHKSNTLTTPSDLTLRGIGDVCDTLDLVSGEKVERIGEVVFDGRENWRTGGWANQTDTIGFETQIGNARISRIFKGMSDKLSYTDNFNLDKECFTVVATVHGEILVGIRILRSKLSSEDVSGLEKYLQSNPIPIQYELETPIVKTVDLSSSGNWEKVVLDGSEDEGWGLAPETSHNNAVFLANVLNDNLKVDSNNINLKPISNHYTSYIQQQLCNKPNKYYGVSFGWNNNTICIRDENFEFTNKGLEQFKQYLSQNPITVWYQTTTHKDSTQVKQPLSFSNGHVQLSSKEGSLIPSLDYEVPTSNSYHLDLAKTSTQYTMKNMSGTFTIDNNNYNASANSAFTTPTSMTNKLMITSVVQSNAMLLEGNLTSKTIPYFKGIKSAFEGKDKIEVLSTGKNLLSTELYVKDNVANGVAVTVRGDVFTLNGTATSYHDLAFTPPNDEVNLKLEKGKHYKVSMSPISGTTNYNRVVAVKLTLDDGTIKWLGEDIKPSHLTMDGKISWIRLTPLAGTVFNNYTFTLQIEESPSATPYEPYKSNITKIPLSSPLRSLPNGVRDEVILDRENNKVKVIQRVGHSIIDREFAKQGEAWEANRDSAPCWGFHCGNYIQGNFKLNEKNSMNDRLPIKPMNTDGTPLLGYYKSNPHIALYKWQASNMDMALNWLNRNPIQLYYQLATPIITEIDLDGYPYIYKDGHIFLNSEIAPTTTMKYSINQSHQIESQNGDLMRHEKEINYLYTLIAKYVNVQYESTLLNLDLELSRA